MATPKRYAVFQRRDPTVEVFGHGCDSKAQLDEWVRNMPGMFIAMVEITPEDVEHGYIAAPE